MAAHELIDAFYPAEIEPDWGTLDLHDERWHSFYAMPRWHGKPRICTGTTQSGKPCGHPGPYRHPEARPVCSVHHPLRPQQLIMDRIWRERYQEALENSPERHKAIYPKWHFELAPYGDPAYGQSAEDGSWVLAVETMPGENYRSVYRVRLTQSSAGDFVAVVEPVGSFNINARGRLEKTHAGYAIEISDNTSGRGQKGELRQAFTEALRCWLWHNLTFVWGEDIDDAAAARERQLTAKLHAFRSPEIQ